MSCLKIEPMRGFSRGKRDNSYLTPIFGVSILSGCNVFLSEVKTVNNLSVCVDNLDRRLALLELEMANQSKIYDKENRNTTSNEVRAFHSRRICYQDKRKLFLYDIPEEPTERDETDCRN